ncbi:MAG: hypothetical protein EA401_01750 [Planctomycetota bacterium]|nr:MAG: hypothetical protein EA401_01750 [Planctomycetota bacterium]
MSSSDGSTAQQRILLTQAEAGMVLAEPVESLKKAVLCMPGTTLRDDLIHRLMLLGIKRVVVRGNPSNSRPALSVEQREAQLEQRFSRVANRPLMKKLRDAIRPHLGDDLQ